MVLEWVRLNQFWSHWWYSLGWSGSSFRFVLLWIKPGLPACKICAQSIELSFCPYTIFSGGGFETGLASVTDSQPCMHDLFFFSSEALHRVFQFCGVIPDHSQACSLNQKGKKSMAIDYILAIFAIKCKCTCQKGFRGSLL